MALHQVSLEGSDLEPWKGKCCPACYSAKGDICECRCGGEYHGHGNPVDMGEVKQPKKVKSQSEVREEAAQNLKLSESMTFVPRSLGYYEFVTPTDCAFCGGDLGSIEHYPHDGGWTVNGHPTKLWLYRTCQTCGYQWSLRHLGVPTNV